ncbi:hypothetical protein E6O75_ATG10871 [Venturia nashicola]|uniref:Uncharacterized protein n=1 Tax=Venturia nashicola TaxID=86259 RepID=A0A4Z1P0V4_9PEZI|nr:hypothetical protein E6O75_ATG10871 [Venturia nashicola]
MERYAGSLESSRIELPAKWSKVTGGEVQSQKAARSKQPGGAGIMAGSGWVQLEMAWSLVTISWPVSVNEGFGIPRVSVDFLRNVNQEQKRIGRSSNSEGDAGENAGQINPQQRLTNSQETAVTNVVDPGTHASGVTGRQPVYLSEMPAVRSNKRVGDI